MTSAATGVSNLLAALMISLIAGLSHATAAALDTSGVADLNRAMAMVGPTTSDAPALRAESKTREPSLAFRLGAALGAWRSAAAQLDYDLKTPSGDGDDSAAIAVDCFDERNAFNDLEAARLSLGLKPATVLSLAGLSGDDVAEAWRSRQGGQPDRCR